MATDARTPVISAPGVGWSPITARTDWTWPGEAKLAVAFLFHIEFVPLSPPGGPLASSAVHRGPYPDHIDVHEVSPHEYGNRVGLFRLMGQLERRGITASAAVDTTIARHYPAVTGRLAERGWSILGHGRNGAALQSDLVDEAAERAHIEENLEALGAVIGRRPQGWAGVEYAESSRTADLLAEAGLTYLCGRPNDEQPFRLGNGLVSVPVSIHLDDVYAGRLRKVDASAHADSIIEAIRVLSSGRDPGPRLLVLGVHPWFGGQPFRAKQFERVLDALEASSAWVAGLDEIVAHYLTVAPRDRAGR